MKIVEVVFDIPVDKPFSYLAGKFSENICRGVRVCAPFGKQKKVGLVISVKDITDADINTYKNILSVYDTLPLLNDALFTLSDFISKKYFSSLGQTLFAMIGGLPLKYKHSIISLTNKEDSICQSYSKKYLLFPKDVKRKEIYIKIIQSVQNGSILLLFPEVSLAEEYYREIFNTYRNRVVLFHSELKKDAKIAIWLKMLTEKNLIVIGTRIAVFSPVADIKTIIIDRGNDHAYNEQQTPKYNTFEVAEFRCKFYRIPFIIGETALSIREYLDIHKHNYSSEVHNKEKLPSIYTVFISRKTVDKDISFFATDTVSILEETLLKKGKVAVIHNSKGTSRILRCEKCEYKFPCDTCSYPTVLSEDGKNLLCRFCKTTIPFEKKCPACKSKRVEERVYGIEKIFRVLKTFYPDFKITKFTSGMNTYEDSDIVIGTIAIKKIFMRYRFSLVIIINGESFLNTPDYNSEEKFLITINEIKGLIDNPECKILIQTRSPNLEIYRALVENNPEIFYSKEISVRKQLLYPPFSEMIKIEIKGTRKDVFERKKRLVEEYIKEKGYELFYSGPSFPPVKKGKGIWKYLLRFRDNFDREEIKKLVSELDATVEVNPEQI
ncbi:MAG: primosomal protein N' [bacterium]|nr:primosomal protein N' [bacterium]